MSTGEQGLLISVLAIIGFIALVLHTWWGGDDE